MYPTWHTTIQSVIKFRVTGFTIILISALFLPMLASPKIANAICGTTCTYSDPWGTVEVAGSGWMGGAGVPIYSNGPDAPGGPSPDTYNCFTISGGAGGDGCSSGTVPTGIEWQCVELVNRLYLTKGWITNTWSGYGYQMYGNAPSSLYKEPQGSITYINPGDVIAMSSGWGNLGHVAVVSSVSGSSFTIASQNTNAVYDTSFGLSNGNITYSGWGTYTMQGVIHRPNPTNSRPAVISRSSGSMDVFYRDANAKLINIGWNSSTGWGSATAKASSGVSSNPTAVARDSSDMDVFYRDTSNNLQDVGWNSSTGWGSPVGRVTDGSVIGDPVVVARDSGDMDVLYHANIGGGNYLEDLRWNSSTGWSTYPTTVSSSGVSGSPTAVARDSTDMDVFYRDSSNNLVDVGWNSSTGWGSPTTRVSGSATGDFSVIARDSGDMDVFYPTTSGGMGDAGWNWQTGWATQTWSGGSLLASSGASFVGTPKAIMRDSGDMDVFYQDSYGNLVDKGWNSTTGWAAPYNRANNIADNPGGVSRDSTDMDIFFRDGGGNLNDAGWNSSTGWGESKPGAGSMA